MVTNTRPHVARQRWILSAAALLLPMCVLPACDWMPTKPSEPLVLAGRIDQAVVQPGETATLTFTLTNPGGNRVTLAFPSACQVTLYIRNRTTGAMVYPRGGGWACATVLTDLTLEPGAADTRELRVGSEQSPAGAAVALEPGDYAAFARVDASNSSLRSEDVRFTVR